ncbi:polysaccharide deacetylase family protein [Aliagarivorans taiwanensis]|uniref:polysaccharide deacetylase family protein n=1 Tax=Aliagarivorans taiwanensis TaxID=561966 RepID=UPI000411EC4A|nr:polysaccharide deacetylase family protein [Aliagarivorans taiwanensis]
MTLKGKARWLHWAQKLPLHTLLGDFCPIFVLHRVAGENAPVQAHIHQPEFLEWCLSYLKSEGYRAISLDELISYRRKRRRLPAKSVVFTVDDGFRDNVVDAGALFAKFQVPLTCFVISGFTAEELWPWDDQLKHLLGKVEQLPSTIELPDGSTFVINPILTRYEQVRTLRNRLKQLSQDAIYPWLRRQYKDLQVRYPSKPPAGYRPAKLSQLERFIRQGHTVCAHTHTHRILSQLDLNTARWEIRHSYTWLTENLSKTGSSFAYPTGRSGDFNFEHQRLVESLGFSGAVTTEARTHCSGDPLFALPRLSLPEEPYQFIQYLSYIEVLKQRVRGCLLASQKR